MPVSGYPLGSIWESWEPRFIIDGVQRHCNVKIHRHTLSFPSSSPAALTSRSVRVETGVIEERSALWRVISLSISNLDYIRSH